MARKRQGKTKLQYLVWLYTWDPSVGVRSGRLSMSIDHGDARLLPNYAKEDAETTSRLYRKMRRRR